MVKDAKDAKRIARIAAKLEGCGKCAWMIEDGDGYVANPNLCFRCRRAAQYGISCEDWANFLLAYYPLQYRSRPPPYYATPNAPGSVAKFKVMCLRVEAGLSPHHPNDGKAIPTDFARTIQVLRNGRVNQQRLKNLLAQFAPQLQEPPS